MRKISLPDAFYYLRNNPKKATIHTPTKELFDEVFIFVLGIKSPDKEAFNDFKENTCVNYISEKRKIYLNVCDIESQQDKIIFEVFSDKDSCEEIDINDETKVCEKIPPVFINGIRYSDKKKAYEAIKNHFSPFPRVGDKFYYISSIGAIQTETYIKNNSAIQSLVDIGNCYQNNEKATEAAIEFAKIFNKIKG